MQIKGKYTTRNIAIFSYIRISLKHSYDSALLSV